MTTPSWHVRHGPRHRRTERPVPDTQEHRYRAGIVPRHQVRHLVIVQIPHRHGTRTACLITRTRTKRPTAVRHHHHDSAVIENADDVRRPVVVQVRKNGRSDVPFSASIKSPCLPERPIAVSEKDGHVRVTRDHHVRYAVAVHVTESHRFRGRTDRVDCLGIEYPVCVTRENRNHVIIQVRCDNVPEAVAVHILNRHPRGPGADLIYASVRRERLGRSCRAVEHENIPIVVRVARHKVRRL